MLAVAETPAPRVLSAEEQRRLAEQEDNTLRELRLFLRDVTKRLATDKRFSIFSKPVDIEEVKCGAVLGKGHVAFPSLATTNRYVCLFRCRTTWR